MKKLGIFTVFLLFLSVLALVNWQKPLVFCKNNDSVVTFDHSSITRVLPRTPQEVSNLAKQAIQEAQASLKNLIEKPNLSFKKTIQKLDYIKNRFLNASRLVGAIPLFHTDQKLCEAAREQSGILYEYELDLFDQNQQLYTVLNNLYGATPQDQLDNDDLYFFNELMTNFRRNGLECTSQQREKIKQLKKEMASLEGVFRDNISKNSKEIVVCLEELDGMSQDFIQRLKKTADGLYSFALTYENQLAILSWCNVSVTREKVYKAYVNRGYPDNIAVLKKIIGCRNEIACILGYPTAAHMEIDDTMAHTPENVELFLNKLSTDIKALEEEEFNCLIKNLPPCVTVAPDGKLYPWDRTYLIQNYKKKLYSIDEDLIAEYFPLEHVTNQLFSIYEKFLGLRFECQPLKGLWAPELQHVIIYQGETVLGHLILDLFTREDKYSNSCHIALITPQLLDNDQRQPGVSIVLSHFPQIVAGKPCLLKHSEVITFFHEFGHALHALIGAARYATLSGVLVKRDFVETPSQMLEEWMWDYAILKQISSHYITHESLPDSLIKQMQTSKNVHAASLLQTQLVYSYMSLLFFRDGVGKDLHAIVKEVYTKTKPHDFYYDGAHGYCAFTHFLSYDAKYYSYLWSKVFAIDLFETIKKVGLFNPEIGARYRDLILAPGGSKDPNELLENFLGRKPNNDAYIQSLK